MDIFMEFISIAYDIITFALAGFGLLVIIAGEINS